MKAEDDALHARIHAAMLAQDPDGIFGPRVSLFDRVERALDVTLSGRMLDVGSGNGYASIWLAQHRDVEEVVALEASEAAVTELLPRNIAHHGVADRVRPMLGSFDAIGETAAFDHAVAFGALHHSACLYSTMASVSAALREGGLLIAHEPVMPDTTSNARYLAKYDVIERMHGMEIRNGDRDDHFFRHAEYVVAAAFNELDLVLDRDGELATGLAGLRRRFGRWRRRRSRAAELAATGSNASRVSDHTAGLASRLMVFRKRSGPYVPHRWRALATSAAAPIGNPAAAREKD